MPFTTIAGLCRRDCVWNTTRSIDGKKNKCRRENGGIVRKNIRILNEMNKTTKKNQVCAEHKRDIIPKSYKKCLLFRIKIFILVMTKVFFIKRKIVGINPEFPRKYSGNGSVYQCSYSISLQMCCSWLSTTLIIF